MLHSIHCLFFIIFTFLAPANAAKCTDQWNKYSACYRSKFVGEISKFGNRLKVEDKARMQQTIVDCFNQNECNNPIPTDLELKARSDCFYKIRNASRVDLQTCIRKDKSFTDFMLPLDPVSGYEWTFMINRTLRALKDVHDQFAMMCSGRLSLVELSECMNHYVDYDFNRTTQPRDYCSLKNECGRRPILSEGCQQSWLNDLSPIWCKCAQSISEQRLGKYQDDYQNCVRSKGYSVDGGDPGPAFIVMQVRYCETCF